MRLGCIRYPHFIAGEMGSSPSKDDPPKKKDDPAKQSSNKPRTPPQEDGANVSPASRPQTRGDSRAAQPQTANKNPSRPQTRGDGSAAQPQTENKNPSRPQSSRPQTRGGDVSRPQTQPRTDNKPRTPQVRVEGKIVTPSQSKPASRQSTRPASGRKLESSATHRSGTERPASMAERRPIVSSVEPREQPTNDGPAEYTGPNRLRPTTQESKGGDSIIQVQAINEVAEDDSWAGSEESGYRSTGLSQPSPMPSGDILDCTPPQNPQSLEMDDVLSNFKRTLYDEDYSALEIMDANALSTPGHMKDNLKSLALHLVQGLTDELSKIRVLARWICHNVGVDVVYLNSRRAPDTSPEVVVERGEADGLGYSLLFKKLCGYAFIECEMLKGIAKNHAYYPGRPFEPQDLNDPCTHAWNRVRIGEDWFPMDLFMAAGNIGEKNEHFTFVRHWNEHWFLCEAEVFVYTHLPINIDGEVDRKTQCLDSPMLDIAEWARTVAKTPTSCAYRIEPISHLDSIISTTSNKVKIHLRFMLPLYFTCELRDLDNQQYFNDYVAISPVDNIVSFYIRLPTNGPFLLKIFAKVVYPGQAMNKEREMMFSYVINGKSSKAYEPFPKGVAIWGITKQFIDAGFKVQGYTNTRVVAVDGKFKVEVTTPTTGHFPIEFSFTYGKHPTKNLWNCVYAERVDERIIFHLVCLKVGEYRLCIKVKYDSGEEFTEGFNYLVVCESKPAHLNETYPVHRDVWGPTRQFYRQALACTDHASSTIKTKGGTCTLNVAGAVRVDLHHVIAEEDDEHELAEWERCVYANGHSDNHVMYVIRLPKPGRFKLKLITKSTDQLAKEPVNTVMATYLIESDTEYKGTFFYKIDKIYGPTPKFKQLGLSIVDIPASLIFLENGIGKLKCIAGKPVNVYYRLQHDDIPTSDLKRFMVGESRGTNIIFHIALGKEAEYLLQILACKPEAEPTEDDVVANYVLVCEKVASDIERYEPFHNLYGPTPLYAKSGIKRLDGKIAVIEAENGYTELRFKTFDALEITHALTKEGVLKNMYCYAERYEDEIRYYFRLVETGFYRFTAKVESGALLNYLIHTKSPSTETEIYFNYPRVWGMILHAANYGMHTDYKSSTLRPKDGEVALRFKVDFGIIPIFKLHCHDMNTDIMQKHMFRETAPGEIMLRLSLPKVGIYFLQVYVRETGVSRYTPGADGRESDDHKLIGIFLVDCQSPTSEPWNFPTWSNIYDGCQIVSPKSERLDAHMAHTFQLRVPEANEVKVWDPDSDWKVIFANSEANLWNVTTNVGDPKILWVSAQYRADSHLAQKGHTRDLLRYKVHYDGPLGMRDGADKYGLVLVNTSPDAIIHAEEGRCELVIRMTKPVILTHRLLKEGIGAGELRTFVAAEKKGNLCIINLRLGRLGYYRLKLSARFPDSPIPEDIAYFVIENDLAVDTFLPYEPYPGLYGPTTEFDRYNLQRVEDDSNTITAKDGQCRIRLVNPMDIAITHHVFYESRVENACVYAESITVGFEVVYWIACPHAGYYRLRGTKDQEELFNYLIYADEGMDTAGYPLYQEIWGLNLGAKDMGIRLNHPSSTVVTKGGEGDFEMVLDDDTHVLRYILDGPDVLDGGTEFLFEERNAFKRVVRVAVPRQGIFQLKIYNQRSTDEESFAPLGAMLVTAEEPPEKPITFPIWNNFYNACELISPKQARIRPFTVAFFKLHVPGASAVSIASDNGSNWRLNLELAGAGVFQGQANVGEPKTITATAFFPEKNNAFAKDGRRDLLKYPIQYDDTPATTYEFDALGLSLVLERRLKTNVLHTINGKVSIHIRMDHDVRLYHHLTQDGAEGKPLKTSVIGERIGDMVTYHISLPTTGRYHFQLSGMEMNEDLPQDLVNFQVVCEEPQDPFIPYEPYLDLYGNTAAYVSSGLQRQDEEGNLMIVDSACELTFKMKKKLALTHGCYYQENHALVCVYAENLEPDTVVYHFNFPKEGYYRFTVTNGDVRLFSYMLRCDTAHMNFVPYPEVDTIWGLNSMAKALLVKTQQKSSTLTSKNGRGEVAFQYPQKTKVWFSLEGKNLRPTEALHQVKVETKLGEKRVKLSFPKIGRYKLMAYGMERAKQEGKKGRRETQAALSDVSKDGVVVGVFLIDCYEATTDETFKELIKALGMYNPDALMLTMEDITAAYKVTKESSICLRTPIINHCQKLFEIDEGVDLYLKMENFQKTGSFKVRGLANQLHKIPEQVGGDERKLITMSAGNYGKAFAYATGQLGLKAVVLMPESAPVNRAEVIQSYGVPVERLATPELQPTVDDYVKERGMFYLHPFDDTNLIAGHASVGLEILEDLPDPDVVIVCCGGGGLLAGVASAIKLSGNTDCRIYGVEPEGAPTMHESFKEGYPVSIPTVKSIAAGLAPPYAGSNAFRHCQAFVDEIILISDEELLENVYTLFSHGLVVEPSGAAAFTALKTGKIPDIVGKKVVVVITGGNVTERELANFMTKRMEARDKKNHAERPMTTLDPVRPQTTTDLKGNSLAALAQETGRSLSNVKQAKKSQGSDKQVQNDKNLNEKEKRAMSARNENVNEDKIIHNKQSVKRESSHLVGTEGEKKKDALAGSHNAPVVVSEKRLKNSHEEKKGKPEKDEDSTAEDSNNDTNGSGDQNGSVDVGVKSTSAEDKEEIDSKDDTMSQKGGKSDQGDQSSQSGSAKVKEDTASQQGSADAKEGMASQRGSAMVKEDTASQRGSAKVKEDVASQRGSAKVWEDTASQRGSAKVREDATSQRGSAKLKEDVASQRGSAKVREDTASQRGSAAVKEDATSQRGSADVKEDMVSERGSAKVREDMASQRGSAKVREDATSQRGSAKVRENMDATSSKNATESNLAQSGEEQSERKQSAASLSASATGGGDAKPVASTPDAGANGQRVTPAKELNDEIATQTAPAQSTKSSSAKTRGSVSKPGSAVAQNSKPASAKSNVLVANGDRKASVKSGTSVRSNASKK
ncbi:uncharacterized protein LOC135491749 [Lineus longissimus]|uniref:uncharacterized protein LOC135491749 n=1 Tax=Lineus longissimus TaxID=88925 RepID=UPI00315D8774